MNLKTKMFLVIIALLTVIPAHCWALSSTNIPLDSPVYLYLEKLAGFGLITSDVKGLKPFAKAEATRLLLEAEGNLPQLDGAGVAFATELLQRVRELVPREAALYADSTQASAVDYNPLASARLRYVYLDGVPRSYVRYGRDSANQSAFGFIGGNLRPLSSGIVHITGAEGTPLMENNEGVIYRRGHNAELRWSMEGYGGDWSAVLLEPLLLHTPGSDALRLQKGYVKLGGGGLELEVGRDVAWFGPGYRGTLTLTDNARNLDLVKLSSPEPVDVGWVKQHIGLVKYALIMSRFEEAGTGANVVHPYFIGAKLAVKPNNWFEIGGNFVRQEGGVGSSEKTSLQDFIFGGGRTDKSNTIAGIDLRFRIPWLRGAEIYGEYAGEDSATFWPFVESYVAGIFIPRLTSNGRNDLRFEYFYGNPILYVDGNFPDTGYTYHGMTPGHSQGTAAQDFFIRYSHWFSGRDTLALEYFHTERGNEGRVTVDSTGKYDANGVLQAVERKNAGRIFWTMPLHGDIDMKLMYGCERIHNVDLVGGAKRTNQIVKMDLSYRY